MSKNKFLEVIEVNGKFYIGTIDPLKIYSIEAFNTKEDGLVALMNKNWTLNCVTYKS